MVILVVATTADPASIGPASSFLSMPGWSPGPSLQEGIESFSNGEVRLLKQEKSIIREDDLDLRWEAATGEPVSEVIFLSRHTAVSSRPALTVHPIGVPHLRDDETPPQGGRPGWVAQPNPRIGPWLRLLKQIATNQGLVPEFEVCALHLQFMISDYIGGYSPWTGHEYSNHVFGDWKYRRILGASSCCSNNCSSFLLWQGLGLGGGTPVGTWNRTNEKVLLGIGGGHYTPRHMDIVIKDGVWVGHLLSGYSLPMEEPAKGNSKSNSNSPEINGMWKHAIQVSYEATKSAFPGGEIIAHLDHRSFKGWQKNAIVNFLTEHSIRIGKPGDFF